MAENKFCGLKNGGQVCLQAKYVIQIRNLSVKRDLSGNYFQQTHAILTRKRTVTKLCNVDLFQLSKGREFWIVACTAVCILNNCHRDSINDNDHYKTTEGNMMFLINVYEQNIISTK